MRARVPLSLVLLATTAAACASSPDPGSTLGPSSPATGGAESILFRLNHGNLGATIPPRPCTTVTSGAVGPLPAPYRVCAVSTAEGHFVTYAAVTTSKRHGITYTDRGPATFLDECYKHLGGRWWEWSQANLGAPARPCTGSWLFHGGP